MAPVPFLQQSYFVLSATTSANLIRAGFQMAFASSVRKVMRRMACKLGRGANPELLARRSRQNIRTAAWKEERQRRGHGSGLLHESRTHDVNKALDAQGGPAHRRRPGVSTERGSQTNTSGLIQRLRLPVSICSAKQSHRYMIKSYIV